MCFVLVLSVSEKGGRRRLFCISPREREREQNARATSDAESRRRRRTGTPRMPPRHMSTVTLPISLEPMLFFRALMRSCVGSGTLDSKGAGREGRARRRGFERGLVWGEVGRGFVPCPLFDQWVPRVARTTHLLHGDLRLERLLELRRRRRLGRRRRSGRRSGHEARHQGREAAGGGDQGLRGGLPPLLLRRERGPAERQARQRQELLRLGHRACR